MKKQCYVRFYMDLHVLYDNRYIQVSLFTDNRERCCHLSGQGNWELSYTGARADQLFEELLTLEEVSWDDFERMGFTQYG